MLTKKLTPFVLTSHCTDAEIGMVTVAVGFVPAFSVKVSFGPPSVTAVEPPLSVRVMLAVGAIFGSELHAGKYGAGSNVKVIGAPPPPPTSNATTRKGRAAGATLIRLKLFSVDTPPLGTVKPDHVSRTVP